MLDRFHGPLVALLIACSLSSCNLIRVDSRPDPSRVVMDGLVEGHIALGIRDEDQLLSARVNARPGSILDLSVWKLLRVEVGLLGASVGIGPLDVGLGVLFYEPEVPRMVDSEGGSSDEDGSCPECESSIEVEVTSS